MTMTNRLFTSSLVLLVLSATSLLFGVQGFQPALPTRTHSYSSSPVSSANHQNKNSQPHHHHYVSSSQKTRQGCELFGGFFDEVGNFMKRFTTKATASHILIKGGAEAENQLEDLKAEINNSPIQFAEAAAKYSSCPSASSGGSLGEFGPGAMVKEFDQIVFNEAVGQVHGPIKTQFGYHLIYIADRTE